MSLSTGFSPTPLGDDLQSPALLDEPPFEEVRRAYETPMGDRQPQVGDARLEVVLEAGERARQLVDGVGADAGRQLARDRPRRRLIAGRNARLEFRPQVGRNLGCEVAHPMRQAALARRTGEAFLDRPHDRQAIA